MSKIILPNLYLKKKLIIKKNETLQNYKKIQIYFVSKIFLKINQTKKKYNKFINIHSLFWLCLNIFKLWIWSGFKLIFFKYRFSVKLTFFHIIPFLKGSISKFSTILIKENDISDLKIKKLYYLDNIVITLYRKQILYLLRKIKIFFIRLNKKFNYINKKIFILKSNIGSGKLYFLKVFVKFYKSFLMILDKTSENQKTFNKNLLYFFEKIHIQFNKNIFVYINNIILDLEIYNMFFNFFKFYRRQQKKNINYMFLFLNVSYEINNTMLSHVFKNSYVLELNEIIKYEILRFSTKKNSKTNISKLIKHYQLYKNKHTKGFCKLISIILYLYPNKIFVTPIDDYLIKNKNQSDIFLDHEKLKSALYKKYFLNYKMNTFFHFVYDIKHKLNFFKKFSMLDVSHNSYIIYGPNGSGKMIFIKYLSEIMHFKYITIQFHSNFKKKIYIKKLSEIFFYLKNTYNNLTIFIKNIEKCQKELLFIIKTFIKNSQLPFIISYTYHKSKLDISENFTNYSKISLSYLNFIIKKQLFTQISLICNSHSYNLSKYITKIVISNYIYLFYKYYINTNSRHFKIFKEILARKNKIHLLIMNIIIPKVAFLRRLLIPAILRNYHRFKLRHIL
ncbi:hypothetical protein M951_chr2113 (nucleomorph) [Lotharella oceanica]|uniref:Uncharacterized protein n=2 Tax=Lotharella oceanica TaxID=641309 RepID=A0A060DH26_9EUKA|nr:hypothetical protein M951_chr2113 [Lotharella oceanica]